MTIKRALCSMCLLAAVGGGPGVSAAENIREAPALRVQWEADPPRDGMQAVCGRVFNDRSATAWHVILLVEELDGRDQVMSSRQVEVLGEIPSASNSVFCVPEPAGATTYRVKVIGADWMTATGR